MMMHQTAKPKKSLAEDPRSAQAVQNYESGLRAMQEHKFEKANGFLQKAMAGLKVRGYMWVLAGFVSLAWMIERSEAEATPVPASDAPAALPEEEAPAQSLEPVAGHV